MGILDRLFGWRNHMVDTMAQKTLTYLKKVEDADRAPLADEDQKLFRVESLMNKLEFSRKSCIIKYLSDKAALADRTLSSAILQYRA